MQNQLTLTPKNPLLDDLIKELSVEDLDVPTLEGIIDRLFKTTKSTITSFIKDTSSQLSSITGFQPPPTISAEQKKLLSDTKFSSISSNFILVPYGFKGSLVDYASALGEGLTLQHALLLRYLDDSAMRISKVLNNDLDLTHYTALSINGYTKSRKEINKSINGKYFKTGTGKDRAQVMDVIRNLKEIDALKKEVSKYHELIDNKHIKNITKEMDEILRLIKIFKKRLLKSKEKPSKQNLKKTAMLLKDLAEMISFYSVLTYQQLTLNNVTNKLILLVK